MRAKSETFKAKLLSNLLETRTTILQEASQLSPSAQNTVSLGVWSVADLIARPSGSMLKDGTLSRVLRKTALHPPAQS